MSFDYESDYERLQVENAKLRDEIVAVKRDRDEWRELANMRGKERDECLVWMSNVPVDAIRHMNGRLSTRLKTDAISVWLRTVEVQP